MHYRRNTHARTVGFFYFYLASCGFIYIKKRILKQLPGKVGCTVLLLTDAGTGFSVTKPNEK
jgi:hypothetical protein